MLKIKENNIKLQIWDTVFSILFRPVRKVSRPLREDTIAMQSGRLLSTIFATGIASFISPSGWKRPRPTVHLP